MISDYGSSDWFHAQIILLSKCWLGFGSSSRDLSYGTNKAWTEVEFTFDFGFGFGFREGKTPSKLFYLKENLWAECGFCEGLHMLRIFSCGHLAASTLLYFEFVYLQTLQVPVVL